LNATIARVRKNVNGSSSPAPRQSSHARYVVASGFTIVILAKMPRHVVREEVAHGLEISKQRFAAHGPASGLRKIAQ
jgi:hypothetical protein